MFLIGKTVELNNIIDNVYDPYKETFENTKVGVVDYWKTNRLKAYNFILGFIS